MPGTVSGSSEMGPQPPPVAPKSKAAKIAFQMQKIEMLSDEIPSFGNHVRCGSVDSVDSNSGSSVSSSSSSGCRQHEGEFLPTRTTAKTPSVPPHNPMQFVKVQSPLYRKAEQQLQLVKEVKVSKDSRKEGEEEWQSNLDNWKSRRRKVSEKVIQRAEEMRQIEAEEQLRQSKIKEQQKKTKTFSQIVEKRSTKRSYNLDLYIGQGDDSAISETPEPDDQEGILNGHHIRSDTSEGMTSETDSIDGDVQNHDKMAKEPPVVPKKPHYWLSRKDSNGAYNRTSSPSEFLHHHHHHHSLTSKDSIASENLSSAEPSDVESHTADCETVSSEDDLGFCRAGRQADSGVDSLCDRPHDSVDSASDLSQDSCTGIEKLTHDNDLPIARSLDSEDNFQTATLPAKQRLPSPNYSFAALEERDQGFDGETMVKSPSDVAASTNGQRKVNRRAASFAEKLAIFSGGFDSTLTTKSTSEDYSKPESLVYRRRTAFEKSKTELDEIKIRRSSCVSPEDVVVSKEERRHSIDVSKSADKMSIESCIKKPPPPVPTKPKMKFKLQHQSSIREYDDPLNGTYDDINNGIEMLSESQEPAEVDNFYTASVEPVEFNSDITSADIEPSISNVEQSLPNNGELDEFSSCVNIGNEELVDGVKQLSLEDTVVTIQDNARDGQQDTQGTINENTLDSPPEQSGDIELLEEFSSDLKAAQEKYVEDEEDLAFEISKDIEEDNDVFEGSNEAEESADLPESVDANCDENLQVHPSGVLLERIEEDDGGVSSSTSSSDTPDTETVIDNLPLNVSPLPNDDAVDGNLELSSVYTLPALENLEVIEEENSLELQQNQQEDLAADDNVQDDLLDKDDVEDEEEYDLEESADQLSPLDIIDQIEMKLMQQLEQELMEDLSDNADNPLEDDVERQLSYLSDDAALLDDFDAPRNVVPPSEPPPPPPPPEPETTDSKGNEFQRINSTRRIKKEMWRRRSDFLGLGSEESISVDDLPPPPPGLEELLKSEIELQRLLDEKQMSHIDDANYAEDTNEYIPEKQEFTEDYTSSYMEEDAYGEEYDAVAEDPQMEDWKDLDDECQIPDDTDMREATLSSPDRESNKSGGSPQNKSKTQIQSLGAAPRAKIMDSNKWITQEERHVPLMKQKSVDPVFREGSYNQNFWLAQEAQGKQDPYERTHALVDRRYSMPPPSTRQPNVTLRTWNDREVDYQPPLRPKSAIWQERSAQSYTSPSSRLRSSWAEESNVYREDQSQFEVSHQCSYCNLPLTEGSAMGIDALQLYFHIECFRCCRCQLQLGNGSRGTDVQVKNSHLYCPKCFMLD